MVAGRVSVTPDGPAPRAGYDVVVVGAGLLGVAFARLLRRWAPRLSLLLVEQGGLPNEGGATVTCPGLGPPLAPDASGAEGVAWVRSWLGEELTGAARFREGWLELAGDPAGAPGAAPLEELLAGDALVWTSETLGIARTYPAWRRSGGYLPVEAATLALARSAVREGVDLALNARARPSDARRLVVERLAFDRRMRLGVHARQTVEAGAVVVAAGADGAALAEAGLDRPVRLPAVYRQFPRLRGGPTSPTSPVIAVAGWALRPAPHGAVLVAPPGPADPDGHVPVGGRLLGVPVGLRRELVDRLLDEPALAPLLASGKLELGKSVRSVRGARFSAPNDGEAVARSLGSGWWLLAGGDRGTLADVSAGARLAADVAGVRPPWLGGAASG